MNDDLISRSALLEEFDWVNRATAGEGNYEEDLRLLVKRVTEMQAVDAEVVRHGRWDEDTVPFCNVCPECGAVVERHCVKYNGSLKRCPNCGCKMDAEFE